MNSLILKSIALLTMIIDHYGAIFQSQVYIYRIIGRLAFPIYCFLLVEGYAHTRNVKKYAGRLLIFAIISEIPFDLAFFNNIGFEHQNILFTLFIGLITIYLLDKKDKKNLNDSLIIVTACVLSSLLRTDYQFVGIIYIFAFYYTRSFPKKKRFSIIALVMLLTNLSLGRIQQFSVLSLFLIYFYNYKIGIKNKALQMSFYIAYPLHLFIFYLISTYRI
ncbi:MAG TPA: TraX protein [Tissierellia bacterium]|nr:TraX protein [Tissierellia bacterium]